MKANNKTLAAIAFFIGVMAVHTPAHAQDAPPISPSLKQALGNLPIAGIKDQLQGMVGALQKTSCGGNLTGCYMTQSGPLQLYFFTSGTSQQTLLLVADKSMPMPHLLGEKVQKVMGETSLRSPIISISTTDYQLDQIKMPPALQKVVRDNYFNVNTLSFSSGVQMAARANLGGPIKLTMEAFGVKANEVMLRAAVVMPIPTDLAGAAGAGAGTADAVAHGATMNKAGADALKPEAFVEFQFAPNARLPLLLPNVTLTDATFFLNNTLTFGYKGNAAFRGAESKKVIMHFQTPLTPAGVMDLLDYSFRMATPANFTMEDAAHVMVAMATPDTRLMKYGGFINGIDKFKDPLLNMVIPLSVVQFRNPNPPPEYRFGDSSKPFPHDNKYFNFALLGPLADGGPYLSAAGDVRILGQTMGWMHASAGLSGLRGDVGQALTLKLGPLGRVTFSMQATTAINATKQQVGLLGNFGGQKVEVSLNGDKLKVEVSASCVNPFEINTQVTFTPSTKIEDVFNNAAAINVDPSKIGGCIGKELEAAYNKIAGEFSHLEGYTASAANAELNKIADAAKQEYNQVKNAARDVASKSTNAAANAFNEAGNAFKKLGGKKKKHKKGPDPVFAASVFDWDYYYDTAQDVVAAQWDLAHHWKHHGFSEGRQGSPEFSATFYWSRYLDVQALCQQGDRGCSLQHWLDYGIRQGRQGSAGFSVASYLDRYPDLQRAFGPENFEDALDHWINHGENEGRDASAASNSTGPLAGSRQIGGGGGDPWADANAGCRNETPRVFNVQSGSRVDGLQFWYPSIGWAPPHGYLGNNYTQVFVDNGDDIVAVEYRSGGAVDSVTFLTRNGKRYGPYGGMGGSPNRYDVTPGEKLGCMTGRSGSSIDQLTFSSTGPR